MMSSLSEDGSTEIITASNPESIDLVDNSASFTSRSLSIQISRCDSDDSSVECASEPEFLQFMEKFSFAIITAINFVDFGDVEPFIGPIKNAMQFVENHVVPTT